MKILLIMLFVNSVSFASLPMGEIRGLDAAYNTPTGSATANYINIEEFGEFQDSHLSVQNREGLLLFSLDEKEFEIDLSLFSVRDTDYIKLVGMNFANTSEATNLSFNALNAGQPEHLTNLSNGSAQCIKGILPLENSAEELLISCLNNAKLKVSSFSLLTNNDSFESLLGNQIIGSDIILNDLNLDISNGLIKGSFRSNLSFGLAITFDGEVKYQQEDEVVVLRMDNVWAGWISITGKFFSQLKEKAPDNIIVEQPYIYINLKEESSLSR